MDNKLYYSFARELRCRYSLHVLIVVPVSLALGALFGNVGVAGFVVAISTLVFLLLGVADVMNVYSYNQLNSERVAREMYRHRDVFSWSIDPAHSWSFAKKCGHYRHVRPYYYLTPSFTVGFCVLFHPEVPLMGCIFFMLLGIIPTICSNRYVDTHLNSPETGEIYDNPQSYSRMLDHAKQEDHQKRQAALIEEQLRQEQARNQGFPPTDDSQSHRPPKPY